MSTISNERLEKLSEYDCADRYEVMSMATELLALRKEREKVEPVGYRKLFTCSSCGAEGLDEPLESRCHCNGDGARWIEGRLYTAPPAPGADDDSLPYDPQIAEYEQMMEAEQAQADTTSQQFESLASVKQPSSNLAATGKASRDSDANSSHDSQTTIKQSDGWIPCSERMPGIGEAVLMRISCSDHFNIESGRYKGDGLWLGCWFSIRGKKESPYQVAHWMPIPAAPEPCK
ncbi:DUF551 domain-containing protein [Cronobacter dublinensis]|uniref:DUF551 domain-containing protein n=1 Tax=Cronobacter dublinensis TaxID=413497 RepID=UPI0003A9F057|nr:DUF551 domain-containing protein [Cronobacter dublinensis]